MNNGHRGKYLEQLEAWNLARRFSAELVTSFYDSSKSVRGIVEKWSEIKTATFPQLDELKQMVSNVVFLNGRDTIDTLARQIMGFRGWF